MRVKVLMFMASYLDHLIRTKLTGQTELETNFYSKLLNEVGIGLTDSHLDTSFLLPISNVVKRYFNRAKFALNNYQNQMQPINFEMRMFLHMNMRIL